MTTPDLEARIADLERRLNDQDEAWVTWRQVHGRPAHYTAAASPEPAPMGKVIQFPAGGAA